MTSVYESGQVYGIPGGDWNRDTVSNLPVVTPSTTEPARYRPEGVTLQQLDRSSFVAIAGAVINGVSLVITLALPQLTVVSWYGLVWLILTLLCWTGTHPKDEYQSQADARYAATAASVLGVVSVFVAVASWLILLAVG